MTIRHPESCEYRAAAGAGFRCRLCQLRAMRTRFVVRSAFTRVVADDPQQVAAAVRDLINQNLCPHTIRSETLIRMAEHRQRLVDLGQQVYAAHKTGRDFARDFYSVLTNKLAEWCMPQQLMSRRRRLTHPEIR